MTVKELIEQLQKCKQDVKVTVIVGDMDEADIEMVEQAAPLDSDDDVTVAIFTDDHAR